MTQLKKSFKDYKNTYVGVLLTLFGSLALASGLYAPMLSKFLISEDVHVFDTTNFILITFGLLCLIGGIRSLTLSIKDFYKNKLK